MRSVLVLILPVLLLAACSKAGERLPASGDVLVKGAVLRIDDEPMFRDGDGRIWVDSTDYGTVVLLVPARRHQLCSANYQVDIGQLAEGSLLRARGAVTGSGEIRICADDSHFLASAAGQSPPP